MSIQITSAAFAHGQPIPRKFTGDGENKSPPLQWSGLPQGTRELALIVDDPDAPTPQPFVHWVLYHIPSDQPGLLEGNVPQGALQGRNSFDKLAYGGPAPPPGHGTHHYHFKLYALDQPLDVQPELDKDALNRAMAGRILDQGELVGTYERPARK